MTDNPTPGDLAAKAAAAWAAANEQRMKTQMPGGPVLAALRPDVAIPGPADDTGAVNTFAAILVADRELIGRAAAHADQLEWHTIAEHLREAVQRLDVAIALVEAL